MSSFAVLLKLVHLIGLALGVGGATAKLALVLRCKADPAFVPTYLRVIKSLTRQIVLGMILLTLSGIGWLVLGYPVTRLLVVKLVLVVAIWVLGPVIDNVVEPRFRSLAPQPGAAASPDFVRARQRYVAFEAFATGIFYVIVVLWLMR